MSSENQDQGHAEVDGGTAQESEPNLSSLLSRSKFSRRRLVLTSIGGALAAAPLVSCTVSGSHTTKTSQGDGAATGTASGDTTTTPQPLGGFVYFTTFEAQIVQAAAARIIPSDSSGPGATEAGVVYFIDRQLMNEFGLDGSRYEHGPFQLGVPTQGDQSGMSFRHRYRLGVLGMENYAKKLFGKGFADISPDQQDQILTDMENGTATGFDGTSVQSVSIRTAGAGTEVIEQVGPSGFSMAATAFFTMFREHVIAGFFSDPVHGGNRDMVGWKFIGFPGVQMSYASQISQYGKPFAGQYRSLKDYQQSFDQGA